MGGADFTEKEMKRVLDTGFPNHFRKFGKNHYELKSKRGICPYLAKDNSCSIHSVRPSMCRCWPVYPEFHNGKRILMIAKCPLTPLLSKKNINKMKKQARGVSTDMADTISCSKLSASDIKLIKRRLARFKMRKLK
jgi:Fe-S-cluster containining protein